MKTVGEKIRLERRKRGLTLDQVSKATGLSRSYLSQLERGLSEASVTSLKKIGRYLEISVVRFFEENGENNQNRWGYTQTFENQPMPRPFYSKDVKVIRADRRKGVTFPGSEVIYEVLTPDLNRQLEVMCMRISRGDTSGDEPIIDPPGEKFGLVLKGAIELTIGNEVFHLGKGDSVCFPSDAGHSWRGIDGKQIEVIWVVTPPAF
jgi:transcriptional regulator with XRE-family HTH domain